MSEVMSDACASLIDSCGETRSSSHYTVRHMRVDASLENMQYKYMMGRNCIVPSNWT